MKSATSYLRLSIAASVFASALIATNAPASALTQGNILVYRVGTGVGALGGTATAVFMDEYNSIGALVQSIALPSTGASALTAVGNDSTEGIMSVSQDSTTVNFTGYRANAGTANIATTDPSTLNRVVGRVSMAGLANTSVALTDPSGTIRSATSLSGGTSPIYVGGSFGLNYVASPSGAATSTQIDSRSTRQTILSGNNVLVGADTAAGILDKVVSFGILPTGPTSGTAIVATSLTDNVNSFALFDLSSSVAGPDTLYVLSSVGNLVRKYTFDGTTWNANGTIASNGALNITGYDDNGTVHLFTTTRTTLNSVTDASGFGANITGSSVLIASAGLNTAFDGVTLIPEPSIFALSLMAAATLLALRRRQA
jgi:hypothetical protein